MIDSQSDGLLSGEKLQDLVNNLGIIAWIRLLHVISIANSGLGHERFNLSASFVLGHTSIKHKSVSSHKVTSYHFLLLLLLLLHILFHYLLVLNILVLPLNILCASALVDAFDKHEPSINFVILNFTRIVCIYSFDLSCIACNLMSHPQV